MNNNDYKNQIWNYLKYVVDVNEKNNDFIYKFNNCNNIDDIIWKYSFDDFLLKYNEYFNTNEHFEIDSLFTNDIWRSFQIIIRDNKFDDNSIFQHYFGEKCKLFSDIIKMYTYEEFYRKYKDYSKSIEISDIEAYKMFEKQYGSDEANRLVKILNGTYEI